jgi:hemolysin III
LPPRGSFREYVADGLVHLIGLIAGLIGAAVLVGIALQRGQPAELGALVTYAVCLLAMLGCSAAYNLARSPRWREFLCRFDHAAIFAMIAGTYTPFTTLRMEGAWGIGLTTFIWGVAAIGMGLKLWRPRRFEPLFVGIYLALGWTALAVFDPLLAAVGPTTMALLAAGGILYSVGVIFHVWESLPFQRAVWHGFVLAAAVVHYVAVLDEIVASPLPL